MTPDQSDRASEQEETQRQAAIKHSRRPEGPKATGRCLYCESPLSPGLRWCDSACRDDYQREQR